MANFSKEKAICTHPSLSKLILRNLFYGALWWLLLKGRKKGSQKDLECWRALHIATYYIPTVPWILAEIWLKSHIKMATILNLDRKCCRKGRVPVRLHFVTNEGITQVQTRGKAREEQRLVALHGRVLSLGVRSASMKSGPSLRGWMLHEYFPHHLPPPPQHFSIVHPSARKRAHKQSWGEACQLPL